MLQRNLNELDDEMRKRCMVVTEEGKYLFVPKVVKKKTLREDIPRRKR